MEKGKTELFIRGLKDYKPGWTFCSKAGNSYQKAHVYSIWLYTFYIQDLS